jgi:hypothetical protein
MPQLNSDAWSKLDDRMNGMIGKVESLSPDSQITPFGKSFSPIEAIEHLAMTERYYVKLIQQSDASKLSNRRGKPNFIYRLIIKQMAKPALVASPTIKDFTPGNNLTLESVVKNWRTTRNELRALVEPSKDHDAAIMKHPLMGFLSPYDIWFILEKHQDYHDIRLPSSP